MTCIWNMFFDQATQMNVAQLASHTIPWHEYLNYNWTLLIRRDIFSYTITLPPSLCNMLNNCEWATICWRRYIRPKSVLHQRPRRIGLATGRVVFVTLRVVVRLFSNIINVKFQKKKTRDIQWDFDIGHRRFTHKLRNN